MKAFCTAAAATFGLALSALAALGHAAPVDSQLPRALQALVPAGQEVLAWRSADLDLDGRRDYVFVLQPSGLGPYDTERGEAERPVWIALAAPRGRWRVALRNSKLAMCHQCGGTWPEPFDSLYAEAGRLTISHYGGSRWRWSNSFRFDYDAKARTWFLSAAQYGADTETDGHQVRTYVRGRHFGHQRLADFDSGTFGQRRLRPGVAEPRSVRDGSRS